MLIFAFIGAAAAFLILDLVWLGLVAQKFYAEQMGDLMAPSFNISAAIGFYVIYLIGVVIFAIQPALSSGALTSALLRGAAFGFFCYATYDLTNLAVMRGYPAQLAFVDIAWGTFLTGAAATAGYIAARLGG